MLKEETRHAIAGIARAHDLDLVVLFGSRAAGGTHERSDWDLAARARCGRLAPGGFLDLCEALRELFGGDVDLVDLGRADPLLMRQVFRRGVPLFEEPGGFYAARLQAFLSI